MAATPDFEAEGLLEGLDERERAERTELLAQLHGEYSIEELRTASANGTLPFLAAARAVGPTARYSLREIVERSGLPSELILHTRRAMGFAAPPEDERVFDDDDLALLDIARRNLDIGMPLEDILDVTRVLARGLSQTAETMRASALRLALRPGHSETELAVDYTQVVEQLMPVVEPLLGHMMRRMLRDMAQTEALSAAERQAGVLPGAREVAVCFADLVGFTRVGEEVAPDELGGIATELERLAVRMLTPNVRLVKTIGDAVMLVSPDAPNLIDTALGLLDGVDEDGALPQLRVGAAHGSALLRSGDWFGRPVNLASRVTGIAYPGSMLVAGELRERAERERGAGAFHFSFAGERRIKGVREPVTLFRVRRSD